MDTETPEIPGRIKLLQCPQCDYSLTGLPENHRCPECGFAYDDHTFVLTGISRGTTGMDPGRKWLWISLAIVGTFLPSFLPMVFFGGAAAPVVAAVSGISVLILVYLISTGKRERRGVDRFIFAAGGFGHCADLTAVGVTHAKIIPWSEVTRVLVSRIGSRWYRLRIGIGSHRPNRFQRVYLDLGIRCDEHNAQWISEILNARIEGANLRDPLSQTGSAVG